MAIQFSNRLKDFAPSEIGEILEVTQKPEIISFAGGLPAPELFPIEDVKQACKTVLENQGAAALQYSTTEGYIPLRKQICERMKALDMESPVEDVIITTGSQQALDLTGKIFLDEGDVVICESPTYLAAINAFKTYQCKFVEIPMDDEGMSMVELEKSLKEYPHAKFIYTIPDFQNPTGRTLSLERRKKIIALANQYDIPIVEDNPYGAVRFAGEMLPPIKHFDTEGRVIYLSTFSKIFSPGLRLGWIYAAPHYIQRYIFLKESTDLHSNIFSQMITAAYMEAVDIEGHIDKIKEVYKERRNLMVDCIEREFPKDIHYTTPEGGLFLWVELPPQIDTKELFYKALKNNVAFVPGAPFYPNGGHKNAFRLNYSNMSNEKILEGMKRLGDVLKEVLDA
ncbi:MAG: PLP-dependent aminotransferase family protein [Thermotaleaceae bacterium]